MAKFLSNVIKLFSATLAGQVLGILVTPLLSRLYSPADYGVFQLFFSIVSIIAVFSCFSYSSAIQLPEKDEDAAGIVVLSVLLIVITTVITSGFFLVFSSYFESLLNAPGFSVYILLLPLALLSSSIASVLVCWLSRKEEFGVVAQGNFFSSVAGKGVSLGYGVLSPSPFGLILGTIVNDATIVLVLLRRTLGDLALFRKVSYEKIKQLAFRYKKFPQYQVAADLAGTASTAAPPLVLAVFFPPVVIGYFAMALMVIRLPSKLMGSAIYQVFYQKACVEKNRTGSIRHIVETIHTRLISLGTFPCVLLMILGPELFSLALGSQWETAGVYAQIIAPWMFFAFILVPLAAIFNVLEQQAADFWFSVLLLSTRIIVLVIGGLIGEPVLVMVLLSSTGVLFWGWMNMYTLKIAGVSVSGAILEILRYFLICALVCLPLIIIKYFSISSILLMGTAAVIAIFYYSVVIYRDEPLRQGLVIFFRKIIGRIRTGMDRS